MRRNVAAVNIRGKKRTKTRTRRKRTRMMTLMKEVDDKRCRQVLMVIKGERLLYMSMFVLGEKR